MVSTQDCKNVLGNTTFQLTGMSYAAESWSRHNKFKDGDDVLRTFVNKEVPLKVIMKEAADKPEVVGDAVYINEWDFYNMTKVEAVEDAWVEYHEDNYEEFKSAPRDFVFHVAVLDADMRDYTPAGLMLNLSPKSYWDSNKCAYDQHFDVDMPSFISDVDDMEGEWSFLEEMSIDEAKTKLIEHGFTFDEEYWNFIQSHYDG